MFDTTRENSQVNSQVATLTLPTDFSHYCHKPPHAETMGTGITVSGTILAEMVAMPRHSTLATVTTGDQH